MKHPALAIKGTLAKLKLQSCDSVGVGPSRFGV